jgi:hypothetical protein
VSDCPSGTLKVMTGISEPRSMGHQPTPPPGPDRDELRDHLRRSRIAGAVATSRENNLGNYQRMSRGEPLYSFGLRPRGTWTPSDVLELMAERCGVSADPSHTHGQDTIDPDQTLDRLDAMAARLSTAAAARERVIVATGHPVGLRPTHTAVATALKDAGCRLLTAVPTWRHPADPAYGGTVGSIAFVDGVGVLVDDDGVPVHTHSPLPMQAVLADLDRRGEAPPDLVVADHGWAGAAAQQGIDSAGFADSNDPALFVGEAEGQVLVCVPLDDNVAPHLYEPLTTYLLHRAGLRAETHQGS